jgi:hypothetical protein
MFLDLVEDIAHSESCFEWDKCDDCWDDQVVKSIYEPEPVDAEMVGRSTIQDDDRYAGYSPADRKFQLLDMTEDLADLDAYKFYKYQAPCSKCNLFYNTRLGFCPNC